MSVKIKIAKFRVLHNQGIANKHKEKSLLGRKCIDFCVLYLSWN